MTSPTALLVAAATETIDSRGLPWFPDTLDALEQHADTAFTADAAPEVLILAHTARRVRSAWRRCDTDVVLDELATALTEVAVPA